MGQRAAAPLRPGYGMPTRQERRQNLRSAATLRVLLMSSSLASRFGTGIRRAMQFKIANKINGLKHIFYGSSETTFLLH
jgi:hypothetical protein